MVMERKLNESVKKFRKEHRVRTALEAIVRQLLLDLAPDRTSFRKKGKNAKNKKNKK